MHVHYILTCPKYKRTHNARHTYDENVMMVHVFVCVSAFCMPTKVNIRMPRHTHKHTHNKKSERYVLHADSAQSRMHSSPFLIPHEI